MTFQKEYSKNDFHLKKMVFLGTTNKRLKTQSVRSSQFDQVPGYLS